MGTTKLTEEECGQLAEKAFDQVIGPGMPAQWHTWAAEWRMTAFDKLGIFPPPPMMIINDQPIYMKGEQVEDRRRAIDREYAEMMRKLERKEIVPVLKIMFIRDGYTRQHATELESGMPSHLWWQIMEEIEKFVFLKKRGRRAKILTSDYPKIAALADELFPVCEQLLETLDGKTKHTIQEILGFLKMDHPKAASFLLAHVGQLQKALANTKFMERRKTLTGRARLLAAGLAGSDFGLTLLNSASIAEQGKRIS